MNYESVTYRLLSEQSYRRCNPFLLEAASAMVDREVAEAWPESVVGIDEEDGNVIWRNSFKD